MPKADLPLVVYDSRGRMYEGLHQPKRQHAFAALLTCPLTVRGRDEKRSVDLSPLHGYRGPRGNTYIREEDLASLF